jgi:hypothetical protein
MYNAGKKRIDNQSGATSQSATSRDLQQCWNQSSFNFQGTPQIKQQLSFARYIRKNYGLVQVNK